jgi:hypothetical protein
MVDIALLTDLGFEQGTGFEVETWVFDGMFWVECLDGAPTNYYTYVGDEHGAKHDIAGRKQFIGAFIDTVLTKDRDASISHGADFAH